VLAIIGTVIVISDSINTSIWQYRAATSMHQMGMKSVGNITL
jgi:hypothetical protein